MRHIIRLILVLLAWCLCCGVAGAQEKATNKEIQENVKALGSKVYVVRKQATDFLEKQPMDFDLYIRLRDANVQDTEILRRIEYVVQPFEYEVRRRYRVNLDHCSKSLWVHAAKIQLEERFSVACKQSLARATSETDFKRLMLPHEIAVGIIALEIAAVDFRWRSLPERLGPRLVMPAGK